MCNARVNLATGFGLMSDFIVISRLVGCGVGAILALFLAILAWRSREQCRGARLLFAACAFAWNVCGVLGTAFTLTGFTATLIDVTETFRFTAAALWPVSAVGMWLSAEDGETRRHELGELLFRLARISAALIVFAGFAAMWIGPRLDSASALAGVLKMHLMYKANAYHGYFVFAAGIWLLVRHQGTGRFQQLALWTMVAGLALCATGLLARDYFSLPPSVRSLAELSKEQGLTLLLIGSLFYYARFRAVDVFLKLSLRLFAGVTLALLAAALAVGPIQAVAEASRAPFSLTVVGYTAVIGLAVFLMQRVARMADAFVERHVLGKPDYAKAAAELRERLAPLESVPAVIAETEDFLARTLGTLNVRVHPSDGSAEETNAADVVQTPILVGNRSQYVLSVSSRSRQHIVVTIDVEFLRDVAVIVGRRLEALAREQDRLERARREAQLVHQVVSAELRALRAQLNPHFLFNALNTIAALIPPEPEKAERMVVQLAKVFRHLLAHSEKSFSSLQEEIEFLRTYLEIEKVRFGERLTVEFDISEAAATATVPSLILQPLVENALKHGLATKRGDNLLVIRADRQADALSVSVEDNGVGIPESIDAKPAASAGGVGLRNIRERLRTIYGHRASLVLENTARGGSRALIVIPVMEMA